MRYLSVCSGIEAATVAWHPLGWEAAAFSEIEAFPRAVLKHHYPDVPLHGDFTTIGADEYGPIDLLVGGTPCQSFSIAGLRGGLADDRGNLALEFLRLADRTRPRWVVWENVPGVLSSGGGRDFGSILGGLVELGYGFAYRVLDAQYAGVPQRRRRVFVVGHSGDWRRAAAVLFERHSLQGHPAPRREAGPAVAALTANGVGTCGADDNQGQAGHLIEAFGGNNTAGSIEVATALNAHGGPHGRCDFESETFVAVAPCLDANYGRLQGHDNQHIDSGAGLFVNSPVPFDTTQITSAANYSNPKAGDPCHPLAAGAHPPAVAFNITPSNSNKDYNARQSERSQAITGSAGNKPSARGGDLIVETAVGFQSSQSGVREVEAHATLDSNNGSRRHNGIIQGSAVRRLTPVECERLQGFPDDYTAIPWRGKPASECPDGPRYKALGNSMAVPVMAFIGQRIAAVDALELDQREAA